MPTAINNELIEATPPKKLTLNSSWKKYLFSDLFHSCIVKKDPLGGLGVESEGTIVTAGVADHPHQKELSFFGMLICYPVEELFPHEHINIYLLASMLQ